MVALKTKTVVWGNLIMKKYKFLYRIIIELMIIWFIFEWNNKFIVNSIAEILNRIKLFPIAIKTLSILKFISPYGRIFANDLYFLYWFNICTGVVLFCFCLFFILTFMDGFKHFISKSLILLISNFITWYGAFGIAWLICKMPTLWSGWCWFICIGLCFLLELLSFFVQFKVFGGFI